MDTRDRQSSQRAPFCERAAVLIRVIIEASSGSSGCVTKARPTRLSPRPLALAHSPSRAQAGDQRQEMSSNWSVVLQGGCRSASKSFFCWTREFGTKLQQLARIAKHALSPVASTRRKENISIDGAAMTAG